MLQDATLVILALVGVGVPVALVAGDHNVAAIAMALAAHHLVLLVQEARPNRVPAWVERAPVISLAVANVYVDNDEIERCVQQLLGTAAEVVVVVETTPAFRAEFDAAGGTERYPYRIFDPDDTSEYAVSLYTSLEPSDMAMVPIGELVGAAAHVPVGCGWLQVIGVLAQAAVDPGGMPRGSDRWPPWGASRAISARRS